MFVFALTFRLRLLFFLWIPFAFRVSRVVVVVLFFSHFLFAFGFCSCLSFVLHLAWHLCSVSVFILVL